MRGKQLEILTKFQTFKPDDFCQPNLTNRTNYTLINDDQMSYDLFFYKRKTNSITKADIESYLNNLPSREGNQDNQWFFQNESSGAYWTFEYYQPDENEPVDPETDEGYEDFEDTQFTFNINMCVPTFLERKHLL